MSAGDDYGSEEWGKICSAVLEAVRAFPGLLDEHYVYEAAQENLPTLTYTDYCGAIGWLAGTRKIEPAGGWARLPRIESLMDMSWRVVDLPDPGPVPDEAHAVDQHDERHQNDQHD